MRTPSRHFCHPIALGALAVLAACGGGDGGTTPTPTPQGFTVSLSATTLSVEQGASGAVTATIGRTGSFTGTVNLSTENLPAGITASFNPSDITASTTSTTLTVTAAAAVAPGPYTFTIRGQAAGVSAQQTATVSLTVTPRPAIALTLAPTTATVAAGGTTSYAATVARTNFSGAVTVTATGGPAGVTTTVTAAGDVHTIAVAVAASVTAGSYTLTTTATGSGVTAVSAAFTLTVTAAAPPSISLTATPPAITVQAGGAGVATTIGITRTNFTGTVVVAVQSGLPTGVTTSNNPTGPTAANAVDVTFTAAGTATPGTYNVVLQGAGFQAAAGTVTVALTITAAAAPSIALSAAPNAATATAGGGAVTSTVTIARTNYTGAVTLVASGAPAGVTPQVTPSPTTGTTATLTLTAGAGATPGSYPITVTASGTGVANATTVVTLTVAAPVAGIAVAASPAALSIQRGAAATTALTITRSNFSGTVSLAATGAVTGLTLTLTPTSTTGNSATLNVAVGSGTALGTYPITVTASANGVTSAQVVINVTVTQVSSGGNVTWHFCAATGIPVWVAVQDGNSSAPWVQVPAGVGSTYSFNMSGAGGVAVAFSNGSTSHTVNVTYGSLAELQSQGTATCGSNPVGKTVTGTVTGFQSASDIVLVSMGTVFASPPPSQALPNFSLPGVLDGPRDLLGTRSALNIANPSNPITLNKIFMKRGLNPPNLGSVGTVDFNGADAFDPDSRTVTIGNAIGGEGLFVSNQFITNTNSFASLGSVQVTSGNVASIFTVPSAKTASGDVHAIAASAVTTTGTVVTQIRSTTAVFRDPANQSVSLGSAVNTPSVSAVATAPYARLRTQAVRQSDYNDAWSTTFAQSQGGVQRSSTITMSSAYMGGATSFDVTIPDFTGVGGWQNLWGLVAGTNTTWNVTMSGWVTGTGGLVDGTIFRTGQRNGTITP